MRFPCKQLLVLLSAIFLTLQASAQDRPAIGDPPTPNAATQPLNLPKVLTGRSDSGRSGWTSSGSTIARCRSTSAGPSRDPAFAPMFPWGLFGRARRICMYRSRWVGPGLQAWPIATFLVALACPGALARELSVTPGTMARIGTIDERFQSYNIEMVEVTGGRFWKPYGPNASDVGSDLYAYRAPIDLTNSRLRRLAAALAPAYVRVSGTWANTTYFADSDTVPSAP